MVWEPVECRRCEATGIDPLLDTNGEVQLCRTCKGNGRIAQRTLATFITTILLSEHLVYRTRRECQAAIDDELWI